MIEAGVAAASGRPRARPTDQCLRRGGWKAWADHRGQLAVVGGLGREGRRERVGEKEEDGATARRERGGGSGEGGRGEGKAGGGGGGEEEERRNKSSHVIAPRERDWRKFMFACDELGHSDVSAHNFAGKARLAPRG